MTTARLARTLLSLGVVALVVVSATRAATIDPLTGSRVRLVPPPAWSFYGTFLGSELLLVDSLRSQAIRYSMGGEQRGTLPAFATTKPTIVHATSPSTLLVEDEDGFLAELDAASYRQRREWNLLKQASGQNRKLIGVYEWVPLEPRVLLLLGDVEEGSRQFTAFMQLPLTRPQDFEILHTIQVRDPARRFYLLGYPYIAGIEGRPYYLLMTENPHIVRPEGNELWIRSRTAAGTRLLRRPDLPEMRGVAGIRASYSRFEASSLPAGLYGWRGHLYILMHTARPETGVIWSILKVNPEEGRTLWHRRIDTTAEHLTVIPGAEQWAFVEKGSVRGLGEQPVKSVLFVPSSEF